MRTAKQQNGRRYTYGDYCSWDDEGRYELIEGEVFDMTPAPSRTHSTITTGLVLAFGTFLKGKPCEVHDAPFDVRLPQGNEPDEEIETVVQPDVLVVCDPKKLDEKGCRGAPDLVVEILSPSTASKDCIRKRALYEKHRVRELWIIDPANRIVRISSLEADGGFGKDRIYSAEDSVEVGIFPGFKVDLMDVFPPLPPKVVREPPPRFG